MFLDIESAVEQLLPEVKLGQWGCQHLKEVSLEQMQKEYPEGRIVQTLQGNYWLWKISQNKH